MLHRQEVLAGGYAGAAIHHHVIRRPFADHLGELLPQSGGGHHHALVRHVPSEEMVNGAGDMPGLTVERFGSVLKPLRGSRVDQQHGWIAEPCLDVLDAEP